LRRRRRTRRRRRARWRARPLRAGRRSHAAPRRRPCRPGRHRRNDDVTPRAPAVEQRRPGRCGGTRRRRRRRRAGAGRGHSRGRRGKRGRRLAGREAEGCPHNSGDHGRRSHVDPHRCAGVGASAGSGVRCVIDPWGDGCSGSKRNPRVPPCPPDACRAPTPLRRFIHRPHFTPPTPLLPQHSPQTTPPFVGVPLAPAALRPPPHPHTPAPPAKKIARCPPPGGARHRGATPSMNAVATMRARALMAIFMAEISRSMSSMKVTMKSTTRALAMPSRCAWVTRKDRS
jgi:hypothetical protein